MRRGVERGILVTTVVFALLLVIAAFVPISSVCETIPMRIDYSVSGISGGPPYNIQIFVNGNQAANIDNSPGSGFYNIEGTKGNQITFKVNGNDALANGAGSITFIEYGQKTVTLTSPTPPATPTPSADPSINPSTTPTASASPQPTAQPTTRAPSDIDDWILGPGLWSTPTPTPVPTATPTLVITTTPTIAPTPTPTPEPTANPSSDLSSWWWLILLLIIVALVAGYWYFTKGK